MQKKPTIILVIDDLGKGGAEMLLVGTLKDLQQLYEIILVTLSPHCDFDDSDFSGVTRYSLSVKNKFNYLPAIFRLRKIIRKHLPVLIHSHLVYSTIITRMACPAYIPLLFSVHGEIGRNVFMKSRILSFLEKLTINNKQKLIAVSAMVLKDYENVINFKGERHVLPNYINDEFYSSSHSHLPFKKGDTLKIVALGNIKTAKNYDYLVKSFLEIKSFPVTLDIYGKTDERIYPALQKLIERHNLPVSFKGVADNIPELFSKYHLYVMSSSHEGFGIAAAEAMASGLPLLLSDIEVLKEVTKSNAIFFDTKQEASFSQKVQEILDGVYDLEKLSSAGFPIAKKYSKQVYLQKLISIYQKVIPAT